MMVKRMPSSNFEGTSWPSPLHADAMHRRIDDFKNQSCSLLWCRFENGRRYMGVHHVLTSRQMMYVHDHTVYDLRRNNHADLLRPSKGLQA